MREKSPWKPRLSNGDGRVYQRLAEAIIEDIAAGQIPEGARLPAQREVAYSLQIGLGSVGKAYSLIARRGLGQAERGRAMFVTATPATPSKVALDANVPPNLLSGQMLSRVLFEVSRANENDKYLAGESYEGSMDHRICLVNWLKSYCASIDAKNSVLCNGGQHAIWIALSVLHCDKVVIVTDELPFQGLQWIGSKLNLDLVGVETDEEGMRPDALEQAILGAKASGKSPILYIAPTAQNPTGKSLSNVRIEKIAHICQKFDVYIVEDDVYAAFSGNNHRTFIDYAPKYTFYVNSLAKILSPWFRLGVLVVPPQFYDKTIRFIKAQGSKVPPLMCQVMKHWITSGLASEIAGMTYNEAVKRNELALTEFKSNNDVWIGNGFHMFLPMSHAKSQTLWSTADEKGIILSPPANNLLGADRGSGIRICLGAPTFDDLQSALKQVAKIHQSLTQESGVT